jgi:hypothetical protein
MVEHTMITTQESRAQSRAVRRPIFDMKERVRYPSVMHFERRLASGPEEICDLFAEFIQRTYTKDVWVPSDLGPEHVPDKPPFGTLQFTSDEVESVLQGFWHQWYTTGHFEELYICFRKTTISSF